MVERERMKLFCILSSCIDPRQPSLAPTGVRRPSPEPTVCHQHPPDATALCRLPRVVNNHWCPQMGAVGRHRPANLAAIVHRRPPMRSSAPHRPPASHSGNQWGPVDNIQRSAEVNGLRPTSMAVVGIRRALRAPGAIGRSSLVDLGGCRRTLTFPLPGV